MTDKFLHYIGVWRLVWRVDISPFAFNLLDGIIVLPFLP